VGDAPMATDDAPEDVVVAGGLVTGGVTGGVVAVIEGAVGNTSAAGTVVAVVGATLTGAERPGSGVPATSPAPVALWGVTMGTPGAGGSGL
jgi:hypothetical protein